MASAPVTVDKIRKFMTVGQEVTAHLADLTKQADADGTYFSADFRQFYSQGYDVDAGKKLGGGVHADAPALDGVIDADAGVDAGVSIQKSREGALVLEQSVSFRSRVALTDSPDP